MIQFVILILYGLKALTLLVYTLTGETLKVKDAVLLLIAPLSFPTMLIISIAAQITDLEAPLFTKRS